jgi:hypothetical protein
MKKQRAEILFWGSCWGLLEVTLGYVIHRFAIAIPGLPGFVMFPAAFWLIQKAVDSSGRKDIILKMTVIAASLKLLDFLIPGSDPIRIINPALSILMEGLAVMMIMNAKAKPNLISYFNMGFLWRGLFLIYMVGLSWFDLPAGLVTSGLEVTLKFLVVESAVNALIMSLLLRYDPVRIKLDPQWKLALSTCALAIWIQWVL